MTSRSRRRLASRLLLAIAGLLALATAAVLVTDRPGLTVEYFALEPFWEGEPVYRGIAEPQLEEVGSVLVSARFFSVRWRGWLRIAEGGTYGIELATSGAAYLEIDGRQVLELTATPGRRRAEARVELDRGLHPIEVRMHQAGRSETRLETLWTPPGAALPAAPPPDLLFARGPLLPRRLARAALAGLSPPYRRACGSLLALAGVLLLAGTGRRIAARLAPRWRRTGEVLSSPRRRRSLTALGFVALTLVAGLAAMPFTAATVDGDDVRYMEAAAFDGKVPGYLNRYVHVYLLKACLALTGGEIFLASRALWSVLFAVTVAALALAARWLGPGPGLRTAAVALFLFLGQGLILGNIGATFPDFTAQMFVTVGVAVYLHQRRFGGSRPRLEWQALALGALTLAAIKSKETGLILVWLVPLMLWVDGRPDLRRFPRRLASWLLGVAAGLAVLMLLDAWLLGDLFFAVRPENLSAVGSVNFTEGVRESRRTGSGWLHLIFVGPGGNRAVDVALRNLWILAFAAPFAATARGKGIERRLLYLMPMAYAALMILLHTRATYIFSARYLLPIVAVCCLAGAGLLRHLGLERVPWSELARRRFLVPAWLVATVLGLLWIPYRAGSVEAAELLPAGALAVFGWKPQAFLESSVAPLGLLLLLSAAALLLRRPAARPGLLVVAMVVLFGPGLAANLDVVERRISAQRGDRTLYPWVAFREPLTRDRPRAVALSPDIYRQYQMTGQPITREPLAHLYFRRRDLDLWQTESYAPGIGHAIVSRRIFESWQSADPMLERRATRDRSGQLVLIRPRDAGDRP